MQSYEFILINGLNIIDNRNSLKSKMKAKIEEHIKYHKDGSIWAKGKMKDGVLEGYWEWFRKDGSIMRSGNFKAGKQTGEWKTYNSKGETVKTTSF